MKIFGMKSAKFIPIWMKLYLTARQAVFSTPTNPFGDDPEEEEPHDDFTVPQKAPHVTKWKYDQDVENWDTIIKGEGSRIGILANEVQYLEIVLIV